MSQFTTVLIVSPLADGRTWYLREPLVYDVGQEGSGNRVEVPAQFLTDFTSVPRPFWWLFPPWGRYGNAAVVHDFCYWRHTGKRAEADAIFLEAMAVLGVGAITRHVLYLGVRLGGWWPWWRVGRAKAAGRLARVARRAPVKAVERPEDLVQ
jgi:hypothetical protein